MTRAPHKLILPVGGANQDFPKASQAAKEFALSLEDTLSRPSASFGKDRDFVASDRVFRTRYAQNIVCELLVVLEAGLIAALAIAALTNIHRHANSGLGLAIASGLFIGAAALATTLWSRGASYDLFASRMALLPTACVSGLLSALAAKFHGAEPLYVALCAAAMFAAVYIAKVPTTLFKMWLESTGRLSRLVAVVAEAPQEREAAINLLKQRDDIEIVFAGPADRIDVLRRLVQDGHLDEVVLTGPLPDRSGGEKLVSVLTKMPITLVRLAPVDRFELGSFSWFLKHRRPNEPWTVPAAVLARPPAHGWRAVFKRALDIIGSIAALILLSPPMLIFAIAIKLESEGPVFFIQERAGYGTRPFRMFKFRSMYADRADHTGSELTKRGDSRVTRLGNFLRRSSADELPQLFNVLIGNMSLVGPRPHPTGAKAGGRLYDELIPDFYSRYRMKPGITGLAQIGGLRGNTETEQHLIDRFNEDLRYADEWTPFMDIVILFRTVSHLLKATNAF